MYILCDPAVKNLMQNTQIIILFKRKREQKGNNHSYLI